MWGWGRLPRAPFFRFFRCSAATKSPQSSGEKRISEGLRPSGPPAGGGSPDVLAGNSSGGPAALRTSRGRRFAGRSAGSGLRTFWRETALAGVRPFKLPGESGLQTFGSVAFRTFRGKWPPEPFGPPAGVGSPERPARPAERFSRWKAAFQAAGFSNLPLESGTGGQRSAEPSGKSSRGVWFAMAARPSACYPLRAMVQVVCHRAGRRAEVDAR